MSIKTKCALLIAPAGLALLVWWLLARQPQSQTEIRNRQEPEKPSEVTRVEEAITATSSPLQKQKTEPLKQQQKEAERVAERSTQSAYQITPVNTAVDSIAEAKSKDAEPFRLLGQGSGSAKIVNQAGEVILEADPKVGIYDCSVSPDGKHLAVYFGGGDAIVLEPQTGNKLLLPKRPPGENKFAFEHWRWIDDNTLIAVSGDEIVPRKSGVAGEENNVAQSRLYLYNVSQRQLTELESPKDLGVKVFSISYVSSKGYVHLVHDDPSATRPPDLGWFEVRPK